MAEPDASQTARQSVFFVKVDASTRGPVNHPSIANPSAPVQHRRKRNVSDPADAVEIGARRVREYTGPTVTETPYGPTSASATAHISIPVSVPVPAEGVSTVRLAPFGSVEYDLAKIRTEDRATWAQWACDLHKEIRGLRHVQDLGPYTMSVIAMMKEDDVWPTGEA